MQSVKYLYRAISAAALSALFLAFPVVAFAQEKPIEKMVTFGTSLSDSGNAFTLLSDPSSFGFDEACNPGAPVNTPPYDLLDDLLVPDGGYAKGGHQFSDGATWIEQFAHGKSFSGNARPALRSAALQASNYAVGGARASNFDCRFNLDDQVNSYLNDFPVLPADTFIVIEMGGNDVRDALAGLTLGQDPAPVIGAALLNIEQAVQALYGQGARKFLLVNVPAIGATPAVRMIDDSLGGAGAVIAAANNLTAAFNSGLAGMQSGLNSSLPGIDVKMLDLYSLLIDIIENPASFGIINTTDACVTPNVPPFQCEAPDTYLFWDGVHPTKAVHGIIAHKATEVILAVP